MPLLELNRAGITPIKPATPSRNPAGGSRLSLGSLPGIVLWNAPRLETGLADGATPSSATNLAFASVAITQSGSARPRWDINGINGMPAWFFDSVDDHWICDGLATYHSGLNIPYSRGAVVLPNGLGASRTVLGLGRSSSGTPEHFFDHTNITGTPTFIRSIRRGDSGSAIPIVGTLISATPQVWVETFDGLNTCIYLNGLMVVQWTVQSTVAMTVDRASIGARRQNTTSTFWSGWIGDTFDTPSNVLTASLVRRLSRDLMREYQFPYALWP